MLTSITYKDTGSQATSENELKQQHKEFSFLLLVYMHNLTQKEELLYSMRYNQDKWQNSCTLLMSTMTLEKLFKIKEMLHKDLRHLTHFIRITRNFKIKVTDTVLLQRITGTRYFIKKIKELFQSRDKAQIQQESC